MVVIRVAEESDQEIIWQIFREIAAAGDSYPFDASITRAEALAYWCGSTTRTYVAEMNGSGVVGAYILRPNQPGRGSHVSNAAFIVATSERNRGIGRRMAKHCLVEATHLGYRAMQFNYVVSSNTSAVKLWQQLGFEIVGTIPGAFQNDAGVFVDVYVMFRVLKQSLTT